MKLKILLALSFILFCASAIAAEKEKNNKHADYGGRTVDENWVAKGMKEAIAAEKEKSNKHEGSGGGTADENWVAKGIYLPLLGTCQTMQEVIVFMLIWVVGLVLLYPHYINYSTSVYRLYAETRGRRRAIAGRTYI